MTQRDQGSSTSIPYSLPKDVYNAAWLIFTLQVSSPRGTQSYKEAAVSSGAPMTHISCVKNYRSSMQGKPSEIKFIDLMIL